MKKETSRRARLLCLILALSFVLTAFAGCKKEEEDTRCKIYWNVDRGVERTLSVNGTYSVLFACNGELIRVPVSDKKIVDYIDSMDVLYVTLDKKGNLAEADPVTDVAAVIAEGMYVQQVTEKSVTLNSSAEMDGQTVVVMITDQLKAYNMSGKGEFKGQEMDLKNLQPMNVVNVYGTLVAQGEASVATHLFVTEQMDKGDVYWRTKKYYDSANKTTLRKPDANGIYTAQFYCNGETVDVKFKDKTLVEKIDSYTTSTCHFGFVFDEDGYAVEVLASGIGSQSLLQCERYDITEVGEDGSYVAAEIVKYHGAKVVEGKIGENCDIYDISAVARVEKDINRKLDGVRVGDRVCIWTDTLGNPVLIYITARQVDSPPYYNPDPQYDKETKKTKRTPNEKGYYEIELLKAGETELQTYYVREESVVNTIDKNADRAVGLKVVEGNYIEYVYDLDSVFGQTYFCRGATVEKVEGTSIVADSKKGTLAGDCKIWNVSDTGDFGAETELKVGDCIYAARNPDSEIINIYVVDRK